MKKKEYFAPSIQVIEMEHSCSILQASSKSTFERVSPEETITAFFGILYPTEIIDVSSASLKSSPMQPTSPVDDISMPFVALVVLMAEASRCHLD